MTNWSVFCFLQSITSFSPLCCKLTGSIVPKNSPKSYILLQFFATKLFFILFINKSLMAGCSSSFESWYVFIVMLVETVAVLVETESEFTFKTGYVSLFIFVSMYFHRSLFTFEKSEKCNLIF